MPRKVKPKRVRDAISRAISQFRLQGIRVTEVRVHPLMRPKLTPFLLDGCVLGVPIVVGDEQDDVRTFSVISDPPPGWESEELTQADADRFREWANTWINERSDN